MRRIARAGLVVAVLAAITAGVSVAVAGSGASPAPPVPVVAATPAEPSRSPLLPALSDPALGTSVAASVVDASTGGTLLDLHSAAAVLPASTAKIVTAVAVLTALPPDTRLTTRVLAGPQPGDVVLVGGGDVTLAGPAAAPTPGPAPARLADLAGLARTALAGAPVQRVLVDDTAYGPPTTGPSWKPGYLTGDVAPVSALSVDGGRVAPGKDARVPDPALAAGRALAQLLGAPAAPVVRGVAAPGAATLGTVDSPPVPDLVEQMLTYSDNDLAESLAHRLAIARGLPATFAGGAQATRDVLAAGPGLALVDGSGLSVDDRVQPAAVAALLAKVAGDRTGRLGPVLSGLPVAGFDGTLQGRYRAGPTVLAAGQVRAKTGTLLGVSALAGLVRTADGRLLAFDVTLNAVPAAGTRAAEAALDRVTTALTGCGCR